MRPLQKMFWEELAEMMHVEEMLLKALLKMHGSAHCESLKTRLEKYRKDAQGHATKLRELFQYSEVPVREKKCDAIMGLLTKGQQMMQRSGPGPALDAGMIAICQKLSAYKIAAYSTLIAWSKLSVEDSAVGNALKNLRKSEEQAAARLESILEECDKTAASQETESARRPAPPAPKKPREFEQPLSYGSW